MFKLTTSIGGRLAAYPYTQYNDDADVVAFFTAYNELAQNYVDFFNQYNLADYNSPLISGTLLDWIGQGIYGMARPNITVGTTVNEGPYGTYPFGTIPFGFLVTANPSAYLANDAVYKLALTWNFFKGDGFQYTTPWLKRRIQRFLSGNLYPDSTPLANVTYSSTATVDIVLPSSNALSTTLEALINQQQVNLPFQYTYSVSVV